MALSAGDRLGPYEILEPLGAGGMGEVYRAHDTKLDRDVALKVLPEGALADEDARGRFRREANALSRLSHPHIATILDFDNAEGTDFLVMELVRGPSLRDELEDKGALPEQNVVRLGTQLARGLQAAHEQGVIHRDLKPSNLQLTPDGLLKILDFGLARLLPKERAPGEETAPTQTAVGKVAGTLPYMAPEQLRGRGVDARTDLYAAGAVLYEMATGRRLFAKPSAAELTGAILNETPRPPRDVNDRVSPGLEAVILKALDKDPELRHQTAKDLLVDLERLHLRPESRPSQAGSAAAAAPDSAAGPRAEVTPAASVRRRRWAATLLVVVAATGIWLAQPTPSPQIVAVRPLLWGAGYSTETDGTRVFQVVNRDGQSILQQVPISGGDPVETPLPFSGAVRLLGTIPGDSALLVTGSHETLTPGQASEGRPLWRLPVPAGVPERIGGLLAWAADASPDGRSLALTRGHSLVLASIDGSNQRELTRADEVLHTVRWSPNGQRIRYVADGPDDNRGWIWEIPVGGGSPRPLWRGHMGRWSADGRYYIFDRPPTHDLFFVKETPWTRWWPGTPQSLTSGRGGFTFHGSSSDGRRLVVSGGIGSGQGRGTLLRYDSEEGLFAPALGGESAVYAEPSPDGRWMAWVRRPEGTLWRSRPGGGQQLQLTRPPSVAHLPRWSSDGTRLVFVSQPDSSALKEIRVVAADGSEGQLIARSESPDGDEFWDACWLPDDSIILSHLQRDGLYRYDPSTRLLAPVPGAEGLRYPKCSRHGDVIASPAAYPQHLRRWGEEQWRNLGVSLSYPNWTRDGRSICGMTLDRQIQCFDVEDGRRTIIADASTVELARSGDPWMGLDAEDRPLVTAVAGEANLSVIVWEPPE